MLAASVATFSGERVEDPPSCLAAATAAAMPLIAAADEEPIARSTRAALCAAVWAVMRSNSSAAEEGCARVGEAASRESWIEPPLTAAAVMVHATAATASPKHVNCTRTTRGTLLIRVEESTGRLWLRNSDVFRAQCSSCCAVRSRVSSKQRV